jgi:prepilin-type N-terminal cleavage/methylation domain-containing protein
MMRRRKNAGYSLIEVLVAIAITSVVLLTIITLFYVGRRNVYSGKQRTYAVSSVGTRVLEDLSSMVQSDVRDSFVIDDNTTLASVTISGVPPGTPGAVNGVLTFTNSIKRDTTTISSATEKTPSGGTGFLTQWKALIPEAKLANAQVGLIITPRSPTDNTKPITTAQFMKVRIYVQWDEVNTTTHKFAFFDTLKVQ